MTQADRSVEHLFPSFASKAETIVAEMNAWCAVHLGGYTAQMVEGYRSLTRQQELFAQGRTTPGEIVTWKDGVKHPSNHQSCLAADLAFERGGHLTWDVPHAAWEYLQHLAHTHGLTSGADWTTFKDRPHVEWPTSDRATYAKARNWKARAGLSESFPSPFSPEKGEILC